MDGIIFRGKASNDIENQWQSGKFNIPDKKKTEIFQVEAVSLPTVWLHPLDLKKLHKDALGHLEQIFEIVTYKTSAARPLAFHLTNHPGKIKRHAWSL